MFASPALARGSLSEGDISPSYTSPREVKHAISAKRAFPKCSSSGPENEFVRLSVHVSSVTSPTQSTAGVTIVPRASPCACGTTRRVGGVLPAACYIEGTEWPKNRFGWEYGSNNSRLTRQNRVKSQNHFLVLAFWSVAPRDFIRPHVSPTHRDARTSRASRAHREASNARASHGLARSRVSGSPLTPPLRCRPPLRNKFRSRRRRRLKRATCSASRRVARTSYLLPRNSL